MVKKLIWLMSLVMILSLTGCGKKAQPTTIAYRSNHDTELLAKDPTGSVTIRVWGTGLDNKAARENAARKAVEEVTFSSLANNHESVLPILPAPTTRAKHREYFNKFFKSKYKKYIKSEKPEKEEYMKGNQQVAVPMIVVVDREAIIKQLKKDNVIDW